MSHLSPQHILIVGGGTAGWMSACLLAKHWQPLGIRISLIESTDIGTVGVGEGSTPYMRHFFAQLGIAESEWMPACHASYKCGIRFPAWSTVPGYESYVHPFFNEQDRALGNVFFTQACLRRRGQEAHANPQDFFLAAELARQRRAPVALGDPAHPSAPAMDYAYHFDAGLLGQFLKDKARQWGVQHHIGTVEQVLQHENGDLAALRLRGGEQLSADFFVDCSGFQGLLINQTLGEPFHPFKNNLFNDRAIAMPTPLAADEDIPSETTSTALRHGWAWHIPLTSRVGNGYVYSSDFVSDDEAEAELRRHLGPAAEGVEARRLKMRVGRIERHWRNNCLAIGLSQGFIEPLEATALMLIQLSVEHFIEAMAQGDFGRGEQTRYNRRINQMFEGVRDYVVTHYLLNTRDDTDYWRANRAHRNISDRLASILAAWDQGSDFEAELSRHGDDLMYFRPSWYCLLSGMGRFPSALKPTEQPAGLMSSSAARHALAHMASGFQPHRAWLLRQG